MTGAEYLSAWLDAAQIDGVTLTRTLRVLRVDGRWWVLAMESTRPVAVGYGHDINDAYRDLADALGRREQRAA